MKYRIEAEALNDEVAEMLRNFIEDERMCRLTAFEPEGENEKE